MAKVKAKVSQALQETVNANPHIEQVHFDARGNHYFNVHKHTPKDKADKDAAGLYGRISVQNVVDKNSVKLSIETPIVTTKIVETASREDILNAEATNNLIPTGLTEEEQAAVEAIRNGKKAK